MTSSLVAPRGASLDFRDRRIFWPVVGLTSVVALVSWLAPDPPAWLAGGIVVAVIVAFGIPHGAVDHLVDEAIDDAPISRNRFYVRYLVAAGAVGLTWIVAPAVALLMFLLLSVHHFGQSDLAYLRLPDRRAQLALQWSRGLFLVCLPLVTHPAAISPIIEWLGGGDPSTWSWLTSASGWWAAVLVAQHVLVGSFVAARVGDRFVVGREALTVAVLTALFLAADPLVAFAVYFGLWHSVAHLLVLADVVAAPRGSMRSLARLAAPLTAVSVAGLALGVGAVLAVDRPDLVVPIAFVGISAVTLPHAVVVERMWGRRSATTTAPTRSPTPV